MQTLYGVKITERVTVVEVGPHTFAAFFDGVLIDNFVTGKGAVLGAIDFLKGRAELQKRRAKEEIEEEKARADQEDEAFLYDLSDRLGCTFADLARIIEIAARRSTDVGV